MATKKTTKKAAETKKTTVKPAAKTTTKAKTAVKEVLKPELTEEKVQSMIEAAFRPINAGLDRVTAMLNTLAETKQESEPEPEISDEIPESPLPDLPPVPAEEPGNDKESESALPLEDKPTVEVSTRSLGGVIREQGVPWNMFLVSILMALVLGAIFASMYFLNQAIQIAPLEIVVPAELELQETSKIDTGLSGKAMVYSVDAGRPFSWGFKNGVLAIRPQVEGTYALMVTIASGRHVHTGYIKFESLVGAGDNRYRSLTEEVALAIKQTVPESERGFCKEVGDNYKAVADSKPDTLEAFGVAIRDKNRSTLGFDSNTPKLDNESNWFNLLRNGGPISDLILRYAGVNPSKETLAKISLAISKGFYAAQG